MLRPMAIAWVVAAVVFAIVEVATVAFYSAFLGVGALGAAVAAALGFNLVVQAVVFLAFSIAGVLVVRPLIIRRRAPALVSGAGGLVGQTGVVVEAIKGAHDHGHVKIGGESWPAVSIDGANIDAGTTVWVVEIRGATLVVHG